MVTMKIEAEMVASGRVLDLTHIITNKDIPLDPDSNALSDLDVFATLLLYHQESINTLMGYVIGLLINTGTIVHESSIS